MYTNLPEKENKTEQGFGNQIDRLGSILKKYTIDSGASKKSQKEFIPPPKRNKSSVLIWLKPIPFILIGGFLFSFLWDFNGLSASPFGLNLNFEGLLRIISVSGMIGFLTNWIAITMLFRPTYKRPLLGQGLIPAQKERIAYRLALAVSEDLINPEIIKRNIEQSKTVQKYSDQFVDSLSDITSKPEFRMEMKEWVLETITILIADQESRKEITEQITTEFDAVLEKRVLEKAAFKAYSFIRGQRLSDIIESAILEIPDIVGQRLDKVDLLLDDLPKKLQQKSPIIEDLFSTVLFELINRLDVQELVEKSLKSYDEKKLETMIRGATNEQLKTIQYLGAVLGTIGGFVIWEPLVSLGVIGFVLALIFLMDRLLSSSLDNSPSS